MQTLKVNLGQPHIVVIGDAMLDRYMVGSSTRQSPEADVPVLENYHIESKLGGAANVAVSCKHLGSKVGLAAVVGTDEEAALLTQLLQQASIKTLVVHDAERPTTVKTRILCGEQHLLRVDRESVAPYKKIDDLLRPIQALHQTQPIDILILQDYNKGVLTDTMIKRLISFARAAGITTAADPKLQNFDSYRGVDLFKPNKREAEAMVGRTIGTMQEAMEAAIEIKERLEASLVLLTLGAEGVVVCQGTTSIHQPIIADRVVDVCGAGDAVLSVAAMAFDQKKELSIIAELAVAAGAVACRASGVAPIRLHDLNELLDMSSRV